MADPPRKQASDTSRLWFYRWRPWALIGLFVVGVAGFVWLSGQPPGEVGRSVETADGGETSHSDILYGRTPVTASVAFDESLLDMTEPPRASVSEPTIVLAIFDTVRADRTSICGYARETTPFLESLVRAGATLSCRAYAPGDWSVPTHASYYTGRSVVEHGAHYSAPGSGRHVDALQTGIPTLAEELASRGYQTVVVSDNRLLAHLGLERGFQHVVVRPSDHDPRRQFVNHALRRVLRQDVDPARPLFLVLNFLAAHDPWPAPPPNERWPDVPSPLPAAAELARGIEEALGGEASPELSGQLAELYDYGVLREDREFAACHQLLSESGWLASAHRIVIAADHGNMLLEHGLWGHYFVREENVRIPLLYVSDGPAPTLPDPVSALVVHSLLLEGVLPSPLPLVHSVSVPRTSHRRSGAATAAPAIALWSGHDKLAWINGRYVHIDLDADPGELAPTPLGSHPLRPGLEHLVRSLTAASAARPIDVDDVVDEELRALGYVRTEERTR